MPQMIPDFDDREWNDERVRLQEEMAQSVYRLITHMGGPGSVAAKFDLLDPSGRPITLTIEAGDRPRGH